MASPLTPSRGDQHRLAELFARHQAAILAYCRRRLNEDDAQDATADVFAVALQRIDDLPMDEATLPWLYGVAYRVVSQHWKKEVRQKRLIQRFAASHRTQDDAGPDGQVLSIDENRAVLRALTLLRPRDQEVLRLVAWEGLAHRDVANVLGITEASARQRYHRAKLHLAKAFSRQLTGRRRPVLQPRGGRA